MFLLLLPPICSALAEPRAGCQAREASDRKSWKDLPAHALTVLETLEMKEILERLETRETRNTRKTSDRTIWIALLAPYPLTALDRLERRGERHQVSFKLPELLQTVSIV